MKRLLILFFGFGLFACSPAERPSDTAAEASAEPLAESKMKPVLMGVALNVADIERSEKYYSEIFNLRRTFQYPPSGGPIIEIGLGHKDGKGGSLLLARFNDDPLPEAKSRYGRIVFNVKDADAIAKRAEERGSILRELGLPRGPGKPILIFFNDPDGYEVELYQAP